MIAIDGAYLVNGEPTAAILESVVAIHNTNCANRLDELQEIYLLSHEISERTRLSALPNNKLVHDFPGYIATMASGYLVGRPVQYMPQDTDKTAFQAITEAMDYAKTDCVDIEIAVDSSVFGRGVEIVYSDAKSRPRTSQISPRSAFVVYDDTVEHKPLFGVLKTIKTDEALSNIGTKITVYTSIYEIYYEQMNGDIMKETGRKEHYFGEVPMVEYWNNENETSDFERVQTLIDAYDRLQSDRLNDKQQFTDSILYMKGVGALRADDVEAVGDDATEAEEADYDLKTAMTDAELLRHTRTLFLPSDGEAGFITKPDVETGNEVLRKSYSNDIHKFSLVPDLTDENFAGVSSGVAMKFKLLGLEQLTKIKERYFRDGLRNRLLLFANFLGKKGAAAVDVDKVQITFSRSLPVNDLEIAQTVQTYKDILPDEMLLSMIPSVEDADKALKKLNKQRVESVKRQAEAFMPYPNANDTEPTA